MPVLLHDILISLVGVACQEFPADVPKRDFLVSKSLPDVLEGIGEDISGEVATRRCSFVHQGVSLADDREIGIVFWIVKGYACSDGLIRVVNCHIPLTDHDIAQRQVVVHDHRSPSLVVNTLQHFQTFSAWMRIISELLVKRPTSDAQKWAIASVARVWSFSRSKLQRRSASSLNGNDSRALPLSI